MVEIRLADTTINPSDEAKHTEVIFDRRLGFTITSVSERMDPADLLAYTIST
jgi:hypothetical protein